MAGGGERGPSPFQRAMWASAMVVQLATASAGGVILGAWLDRKLGTEPWIALLGMVLGIASGFQILVFMVRKLRREEKAAQEAKEQASEEASEEASEKTSEKTSKEAKESKKGDDTE